MQKPRILVTGATGRIGSAVVAQLRAAQYPVRVLVPREDARSEALRAAGTEVTVADMCDVERLADALADVQRAFYLPPFDPAMLHGAASFSIAARAARLESIVSLSQWLASPSHPSLMTRHSWLMEQLFDALPDTAHTVVNPGIVADMPYLSVIDYAAHLGVFPSVLNPRHDAPPSVDDIARVSVASLMAPGEHGGRRYRPTGPALLDAAAMARILGTVFNRQVRPLAMPTWMFMRAARLDGFTDVMLAGFRYYIEDHKRGAFELGAPNDHVERVTRRAPETFEAVARRLAARPAAQRSVRGVIRQLARFTAVPMVRGFDAVRYDRMLRTPVPGRADFATESAVWRREHAADGPLHVAESARSAPPVSHGSRRADFPLAAVD